MRTIYAELAAQPIERSCSLRTECCQFRLTGKTPHLTRGEALIAAKTEELQGLEAELLRSWREYRASPPASRSAMMFDIRARETAYRDAEHELAEQIQVGRSKVARGKFTGVVVPTVPIEKRAISLSAAAGAGNNSEENAAPSE